MTDLGNVLTSTYPKAVDHHKLSRLALVFNGKCIAEKGYRLSYIGRYMYMQGLTLIFMTCKYLWLTRPCQFAVLASLDLSFPSLAPLLLVSCHTHTLFYDSPEIQKQFTIRGKTLRISKWFSCAPSRFLSRGLSVPVLRSVG